MKNFFWVVFTAGKLRKLWWPVESWNGLERRHTHYIFNSVIEINSHFLVTEKRNVIRIKIEHNSKFSWNVRCIGWYFHLFEYLVPEKCILTSDILCQRDVFLTSDMSLSPKTFRRIWPAGFLSQNNLQSSTTSTITEYRLNTEYSINRMIAFSPGKLKRCICNFRKGSF